MTRLDEVVERYLREKAVEEEPYRDRKFTLCYFCGLCGKSQCEWDAGFQPVPGWNARKSYISMPFYRGMAGKAKVLSYQVLDCPKFKEG